MSSSEAPDERWSLPVETLADRLAAALELEEPVGPWLSFWSRGLEAPETRAAARRLAAELSSRAESGRWPFLALHVEVVGLSWNGEQDRLMLALTHTVFEPEAWSRTFLEGLLRRPPGAWRDASVVEVGTGSGWISIALCRFTSIRQVLALDLNPEAVAIARINVYLNGLDESGTPIALPGQPPLWERMECVESDLLRAPLERGLRVDAIIGCIPQVLQPPAPPRSRNETLHDLSNYFTVQGLVEDQFGLGLNAAALDQGLQCLKEGGVIILNLAGRPGQSAVTRMFTRRGLKPRTLWRTRIAQATDTAIDSLVHLEAETRQDFEFFLHRQSPRSIPARTAAEVLRAGRPVWHELQVIEAHPALGEQTRKLVGELRKLGIEEAMREVDLEPVDEEQARFVVSLAELLAARPTAPYPHEAGDPAFREKVAAYLERYTGRALTAQGLFIGPGRWSTYLALGLALSNPGQRWLVNRALHDRLLPITRRLGVTLLPGPDSLRELGELMELLAPDLTLVAMQEGELDALGELGALVTRAAVASIPLLIDDTEGFEITSRATGGGVVGALADHPHGHLPIFVLGLERSRVYPGLSVTLVVHPDERLHRGLEAAAEATYSRIGLFQQRYFEELFGEMTTFRMWGADERPQWGGSAPPSGGVLVSTGDLVSTGAAGGATTAHGVAAMGATDTRTAPAGAAGGATTAHGVASMGATDTRTAPTGAVSARIIPGKMVPGRIEPTLRLPALSRPPPRPDTLRLDYGENEGPMPQRLVHSVVTAFLDQKAGAHDPREERRLELAVARFLATTRAYQGPLAVAVDQGVWPALHSTLEAVQTMRGGPLRVAVPSGHYGMLEPLLTAVGAEPVRIATRAEDVFRVRPTGLEGVGPIDVLWLNQPTNPTGVCYSQSELDALSGWLEGRGAWLLCDEVFGLLRVGGAGAGGRLASPLLSPGAGHQTVIFGGLSKEFAAGGLRLGWVASPNARLIDAVRELRLDYVPRFALNAGRALLESVSRELGAWDSPIERYLRQQSEWLGGNLAILRTGLEPLGFRVPEAENLGGLSCLLDLRGVTDNAEAWVLRLEAEAGVRLNTPSWSETPGFARVCLSVPVSRMEEAVARIRKWMGA